MRVQTNLCFGACLDASQAISTAKAGTTIKIEASVAVDASLEICTSVKLIGDKEGDTIEMLNGPIEVHGIYM